MKEEQSWMTHFQNLLQSYSNQDCGDTGITLDIQVKWKNQHRSNPFIYRFLKRVPNQFKWGKIFFQQMMLKQMDGGMTKGY